MTWQAGQSRAGPLTLWDGITLQTKIAANAQAMKRWLGKAETALGNHSDRLNAINIFPVADGDTGTNLYLTVRAAARSLQDAAPVPAVMQDPAQPPTPAQMQSPSQSPARTPDLRRAPDAAQND